MADIGARLNQVLAGNDKAAQFLDRAVLISTCLYAAALVPEISDDVVSVDRAMEWGYGWGQGPVPLDGRPGVASVVERGRAAGRAVPPLVEKLLLSGRKRFYETEGGRPPSSDRPASPLSPRGRA